MAYFIVEGMCVKQRGRSSWVSLVKVPHIVIETPIPLRDVRLEKVYRLLAIRNYQRGLVRWRDIEKEEMSSWRVERKSDCFLNGERKEDGAPPSA